jgi:ketosteroid isomerase-like protein
MNQMKNKVIILILLAVLMSCYSCCYQSEKNIAVIEDYIKAVENMDFNTMESYLADSYMGLGPSFEDSIGKAQALMNWKHNMENLYEDIKYQRSRNIAVSISSGDNQGEWVSNWAELDISYKDGSGSVTIWANTVYQIENDKIVKSYTFYNEADALRQLGYIFINPKDL